MVDMIPANWSTVEMGRNNFGVILCIIKQIKTEKINVQNQVS